MCPGNYDNYTPLMVSSDAAPPHPQLTTAAQEYLVWLYMFSIDGIHDYCLNP